MLLNGLSVAARAGAPRGKSGPTARPGPTAERDQGPKEEEEESQVDYGPCCGEVCCGVKWCGVVCCGVVCCGVLWCGVE